MQHKISSIEDCIHSLSDKSYSGIDFNIRLPEDQIILSMSRQLKRKIALTDKQYYLAKDKIEKYKAVFDNNGIKNLEEILETISLPLRSIDRSRYISIVDKAECNFNQKTSTNYFHKTWIKIRFPFNKKALASITEILSLMPNREGKYYHEKGSQEHYIKFSESIAEKVMEIFGKKDFHIDPQLIEIYERIQEIKKNPESYIPGIFKDQVKNIPDTAIEQLKSIIGDVNYKTRLVYRDRSIRYGLQYFDYDIPGHSLVEKIALRTDPEVLVDPSVSVDKIVSALIELQRTPVVVLINDMKRDEDTLDELRKIYNEFSKYYPSTDQSVLFRVDSSPNTYTVNDFVKENGLNNWVDEKTKVVYIKKSRLPKLLVTGSWKPITSISLTSDNSNSMVKEYIKHTCDLILYQDTYISSISAVYKKDKVNVIM